MNFKKISKRQIIIYNILFYKYKPYCNYYESRPNNQKREAQFFQYYLRIYFINYIFSYFNSHRLYEKNKFYKVINKGLKENENLEYIFNLPDNISEEHNIIKELLINNYMIYEDTLDKYRKVNKTQMEFNNRWIHQMKTPISVIKLILENEKDKSIDQITRKKL